MAPDHPDVRATAPDTDYAMGRYATPRRSLVIPVPWGILAGHAALAELRASRAGRKVAWGVVERRREVVHVTLAGGIDEPSLATIGATRPLRLRIGGPLVGARNRGRLYLPCYPQRDEQGDPLARLQQGCGIAPNGLYLLGWVNLLDHLDPGETAALAALLRRHEHATVATASVDRLWLLETHDDLALSSRVRRTLVLGRTNARC